MGLSAGAADPGNSTPPGRTGKQLGRTRRRGGSSWPRWLFRGNRRWIQKENHLDWVGNSSGGPKIYPPAGAMSVWTRAASAPATGFRCCYPAFKRVVQGRPGSRWRQAAVQPAGGPPPRVGEHPARRQPGRNAVGSRRRPRQHRVPSMQQSWSFQNHRKTFLMQIGVPGKVEGPARLQANTVNRPTGMDLRRRRPTESPISADTGNRPHSERSSIWTQRI